jgi:NADH dehydrogenase FAD-containing subunit
LVFPLRIIGCRINWHTSKPQNALAIVVSLGRKYALGWVVGHELRGKFAGMVKDLIATAIYRASAGRRFLYVNLSSGR